MRNGVAAVALGCFVLVLGLILYPLVRPYPVCACSSKALTCFSNVKQQATGMLAYAEDSDARFPPKSRWADALVAYIPSPDLFHDPEVGKGEHGYAFNAALSGTQIPAAPQRTPLIYDSTDLRRNASDAVTSLPKPGRHAGRNSIAYADGHARRVRP